MIGLDQQAGESFVGAWRRRPAASLGGRSFPSVAPPRGSLGEKGAGHGVGAQPAFTTATSVLGALPTANSRSWVLYEVSYPKDVK